MSLIRQSAQTFGWQVAGFLAVALSGMITARGLLAAAYLYPQLAAILGSLSLGPAIFHRLSRREFPLEDFAGTLAAAAGGLGAASLFLTLLIIWLGGEPFHRGLSWDILFMALVSLPFLFSLGYFSTLLQGVLEIGWYNVVNHGAKFASLGVVLGLWMGGRLRVWDLLIAGALVSALTGCVPIWRLWHRAPGRWHVRSRLFRQLLSDGAQVHLGSVAIFLAGRANLLLANVYLEKADVGYLYLAVSLAELIWFISVAAETVLYPQVAQMNEEDASVLAGRVCRQVLALSIVCGLLLAALAPVAVLLYGGRAFLPATMPLRLLVPGMVVFTVSKILSAIWVRRGWFVLLALLGCGTGVLSCVLNALLIPQMGISGAALATTLTYLANAAVSVGVYRRWVSRDLAAVWRIRGDDLRHLFRSLFTPDRAAPVRHGTSSP
jgi:O-antigen/teichoic acid export membrane protein